MQKIGFVFGTRPEAIKLAPLILYAKRYPLDFRVHVYFTGQHKEMVAPILNGFGIMPDWDLAVMTHNQTLSQITSAVLGALDHLFKERRLDLIVVQGDTTTVLAASLAAFYHKIPVAHVEAGLRTHNIYSPWPEEMNRCMVSRIARWHFAPTAGNRENLLREGIDSNNVFVTGNTVIDALYEAISQIESNPRLIENMDPRIHAFIKSRKPFSLITGHRRENFGEGFQNICKAIARLAHDFPDHQFVYPVHLNPNVLEPVNRLLGNIPNVILTSPLDYFSFVFAMKHARMILTDSGGVQEEAPSFGKPVLVMRENTERPEALSTGLVKLVGTDPERIIETAKVFLRQDTLSSSTQNPYGDGKASQRILEILRTSAL
jgi:UDP-N-acetylglucosamine 2-epimerase (non-hydrolysing)